MIDLLVVSHACFTAINRNIYHLFANDGWKVEIVIPQSLTFSSGVRFADPVRETDPPIHLLPLIGKNPRIYQFQGLIDLLDKQKPKIVILDNDPISRMSWQIGSWCKKNEAKLFCISCENLSLGINDTLRRRGWKALPSTLAKRFMLYQTRPKVDGIFSINQAGKALFTKEGFKNVTHIPLGFDPQVFYPDELSRTSLREKLGIQEPVVAYFGRLTPEKGIHLLIAALSELKFLPWRFMLDEFDAYASSYNQKVQQLLLEANIGDRIIYVKPNHFEIAAYMNAADIVVVPSISSSTWIEQYGRVAAEALACGKTVVASDSGSLPELLNGHGIIFPEGEVQALAGQLQKLFEGSKNHFSSAQVAAYAVSNLSMERQKSLMEKVFRETIEMQSR